MLVILQGLLFVWTGLVTRRVAFGFQPGVAGWTGLALAVFAIAGYPALAWGLGHAWPELPAFGVAPCPTGIFTFAMLLTPLGPDGGQTSAPPQGPCRSSRDVLGSGNEPRCRA